MKKYVLILFCLMLSNLFELRALYAVSFLSVNVNQQDSKTAEVSDRIIPDEVLDTRLTAHLYKHTWIAELEYLFCGMTGEIYATTTGLLFIPTADFFSQPMLHEKKYIAEEYFGTNISNNAQFFVTAYQYPVNKKKHFQQEKNADKQNNYLILKRFIDENGEIEYRYEVNTDDSEPLYSSPDYFTHLWSDLHKIFGDKSSQEQNDEFKTDHSDFQGETKNKGNIQHFTDPATIIHAPISNYISSNHYLKDFQTPYQDSSHSLLIGFFDSEGVFNLTYSGNFVYEDLKALLHFESFVLNTASLTSTSLIIGDVRTETFTQESGVHNNTSLIAGYNGGIGTYELQSGSLQTVDIDLGDLEGTGFFTQTGGTHNSTTIEVGKNAGSTGTYAISAGNITAEDLHIGVAGTGTLTQSNGTITLDNWLSVGLGTGTGNYVNSGGSLSAPTIHIGNHSTGTVIQTGGTISASDVIFGYNSGSGTYLMSGGLLQAANMHVGDTNGTGDFEQSGGIVDLANWLAVGIASGDGSFRLSDGSVSANVVHIGNNASGSFIQSDGVVTAATMNLGFNGGSGSYVISGGSLALTDMNVSNPAGAGSVTQSGGTVNVANWLTVGIASGDGSYVLSGGTLDSNRVNVGFAANAGGTFIQSGGSHTNDTLYIGSNTYAATTPTYELHSGTLTTTSTTLGTNSVGRFTQTGGTHSVGTLDIGTFSGSGAYMHSGGSLSAEFLVVSSDQSANNLGESELSITDSSASISVSDSLILNPDTHFSSVANSSILFDSAVFINKTTNSSDVSGLNTVDFIFQGGQSQMELAGEDMGSDLLGFDNNFNLDSLILVGTELILVDNFDNQPSWSGAEALYVVNLLLGEGSIFNLNGLNVYYQSLTDAGASVQLNGGSLEQVSVGDELGFAPVHSSFFSPSVFASFQSEPVPEPSVYMLIILGSAILMAAKGK
ncbi:hypothetical protein KDK77_03190 [bacterium]|nr:hypothetical protein [bacterium]